MISTAGKLTRLPYSRPRTISQHTGMPKKPCRTARPNLDEALQLGQAGGWAIGPANGEFVHVTAELLRSWSVDPHAGGESIDELRQRVHPDDRDRYASAIER